uniref:C-type lectin domain-containing protein n=1 Tax=Clytia hemisphaerica TaxID=252671 RepID=A0A7M5WZB1_9CNID|eukprot:TCONS_00050531-protein
MYRFLVIIAFCLVPPLKSQETNINFDGKRYVLVRSLATWSDAESDCNSKGGHLASIQSTQEANHFNDIAKNRVIWLGAKRSSSGDWNWADDTLWSFTHWNGGEPSNDGGNENCLATSGGSTAVWNDLDCELPLPYLCELGNNYGDL